MNFSFSFLFAAILACITALCSASVPNRSFRSRGTTRFISVSGINTASEAPSSFSISDLSFNEPALRFIQLANYRIQLDRLTSHFPAETLTNLNSRVMRFDIRPSDRLFILELSINRRPRTARLLLEGKLIATGTGSVIPRLNTWERIELVRMTQSDVGGGFFPIPIARSASGPVESGEIIPISA
ncbi:hypothetical protein BWQ96_03779 [Gracilariopsis chorda]|uniref:Uncharacterized protein n=1 Tax=Gracilariopsis chorda TaxID=448386 RepID=A0A2V3IWD1_9FLOR|nr:hypothetical protein BWQ96_03779 [Gracilariopsis chorda]|eukprot:PXF46454.1 hypothetical protein BWQ96_03779 [Gracilariopsis chorda]